MRRIVLMILLLIGLIQISFGQKPELVVQTGHTDLVRSVVFSPDGKLLASASEDKTIKLWDAKNGQQLRTIKAHENKVTSIAFSPDGKTIVSGSENEDVVKIWNVETGQNIGILSMRDDSLIKLVQTLSSLPEFEKKSFIENSFWVHSIAISSDGKTLAVGMKGFISLWNLLTGERKMLLRGLDIVDLVIRINPIESLAFSPNGKMLASGSEFSSSRGINLWDTTTGQLIESPDISKCGSTAVFSPNEQILAFACTNEIKLWNFAEKKEIHTLKSYTNIASLVFSSDGKTLANGGVTYSDNKENRNVTLWNVETGTEINSFKENQSIILSLSFSVDGKRLAGSVADTITKSTSIKIWNLPSKKEFGILTDTFQKVTSASFSADGKILATGDSDKTVKVWYLYENKEPKVLFRNDNSVKSVAFSPDQRLLASTTYNEIKIWNLLQNKEKITIKTKGVDYDGDAGAIAFSADSKFIASGAASGHIQLFDVETGKEIGGTYQLGFHQIFAIAFSLDKKTLAVVGEQLFSVDKKITEEHQGVFVKLFDLYSGNLSRKIRIVESKSQNDSKTWNELYLDFFSIIPDLFTKLKNSPITNDWRFRIIITENGVLSLYKSDVKTNTVNLIANLVLVRENKWLVTTPEGFFDGTPNAWKQLLWRFNNNTFDYSTVETYFNDFFYPNLLQDVLAGRSPQPKAGNELEKIDRRQPKVEISSVNGLNKEQLEIQSLSDKRLSTVTVEAAENLDKPKQPNHQTSSEVRDLRLFRNGSLVKIWHGDSIDVIVRKNKAECQVKPLVNNSGRRLVCQANVQIVAGENSLTAYAFNSANVKSNDDSVTVKGSDSLKRDGTLYVLAVGINKYRDSKYNLNFAVPDVVDIGNAIKVQQSKLTQDKQYAKTEIITLTDEDATKTNILTAIRKFSEGDRLETPANVSAKLKAELAKIKPTQPEDALMIYYAGHGTSRQERFYLMPHNFTGSDEKSLTAEGVSDIELNEVLEKVDAGRLLMVIDACQSGQALGGQNEGKAPMNSKGLAQLAYDKGMLILTAAQSQQAALEAVKLGDKTINHGLLTYALLEALTNQESDKDGNKQISEREWFDFAVEKVPQFQLEAMKQRRVEIEKTGRGAEIVYTNGDNKTANPNDRKVQTPRVFYRRETEANPLIIARP